MPVRLHLFTLALLLVGLVLLARLCLQSRGSRLARFGLFAAAGGVLVISYLLEYQRFARYSTAETIAWIQCAAIVGLVFLIGLTLGLPLWRNASRFQPGRRALLQSAGGGLCLAPLAAAAFGMAGRNRFHLTEVKIPIANLPKDLDGLRIVQLTDIHLSPFLSEREFAAAVDMANETRAHVALITGDLITRRGDPLDACLRQLARLRGEAGVLGCLGNHEIYTRTEDYVTEQGRRKGMLFLRHEARQLRFGSAALNFVGVDYQQSHTRYLPGVEKLVAPGTVNILLSHNPDVFRVAAGQGFDLTIAGHTHGGQVNVEILDQNLNAARYFTPYVRGLYREGASSIYVSSGVGTIGVPIRLGAPAEVTLLRLCAI